MRLIRSLLAILLLVSVLPAEAQTYPIIAQPAAVPGFIVGNTLAAIGDSRIQSICQDYPACNNYSARSFVNFGNALSGHRLTAVYDFGVSGDTSTQALARLPAALATRPAFLQITLGVNDIGGGSTDATPYANIVTMARAALAQGTRPIISIDTGSSAFTTTQIGYLNDLNQRLRQFVAATPGAVLFDPSDTVLQHANSGTIAWKTGYSNEGLHANLLGSYWEGVAYAQLIQYLIPALPTQSTVATESRGFGSSALLGNAMFYNATGGTLGTGATGTVPNGFTVTATGAATVTVSTGASTTTDITGAAEGNEVTLAVTCTSAATPTAPQSVYVQAGMTATDFTGGTTQAQAGAEVSVASGATGLAGVTTYMNIASANGTNVVYDMLPDVGTNYGTIPGGYTAVHVTPVVTAPTGTVTGANWFTRAYCTGAGSFTFKVRRPWARKVL
jgi:lysophospholipase L1-like esterase